MSAGLETMPLSIGARATYSIPKDASDGQLYFGFQGRRRLSRSLGLELSVDYRSNNYPDLTVIKTSPVQLSLMAYLMPEEVTGMFFLAGCGWYYTQVSGPFGFNQTYSRIGLHAGVGFELRLIGELSLSATYRYVWLDSVRSIGANAQDKNYQDSGSMITTALNFLFL